jgi:hypothetical protein
MVKKLAADRDRSGAGRPMQRRATAAEPGDRSRAGRPQPSRATAAEPRDRSRAGRPQPRRATDAAPGDRCGALPRQSFGGNRPEAADGGTRMDLSGGARQAPPVTHRERLAE